MPNRICETEKNLKLFDNRMNFFILLLFLACVLFAIKPRVLELFENSENPPFNCVFFLPEEKMYLAMGKKRDTMVNYGSLDLDDETVQAQQDCPIRNNSTTELTFVPKDVEKDIKGNDGIFIGVRNNQWVYGNRLNGTEHNVEVVTLQTDWPVVGKTKSGKSYEVKRTETGWIMSLDNRIVSVT